MSLFAENILSNLSVVLPQTEFEQIARVGDMPGVVPYWEGGYGSYSSFSGADIVAYIYIPSQPTTGQVKQLGSPDATLPVTGILGNIQTISYSTFREVNPVRSLGCIYPNSYTRGPRTVAGTLVWTVFDQYVLAEALKNTNISEFDPTSVLIDQIPPFDIVITFNNEYGDVATMALHDIRIVNEGATFSIDDMITEQTNTYVASGIDLMHKGPPFSNQNTMTGLISGTSIAAENIRSRIAAQTRTSS